MGRTIYIYDLVNLLNSFPILFYILFFFCYNSEEKEIKYKKPYLAGPSNRSKTHRCVRAKISKGLTKIHLIQL